MGDSIVRYLGFEELGPKVDGQRAAALSSTMVAAAAVDVQSSLGGSPLNMKEGWYRMNG